MLAVAGECGRHQPQGRQVGRRQTMLHGAVLHQASPHRSHKGITSPKAGIAPSSMRDCKALLRTRVHMAHAAERTSFCGKERRVWCVGSAMLPGPPPKRLGMGNAALHREPAGVEVPLGCAGPAGALGVPALPPLWCWAGQVVLVAHEEIPEMPLVDVWALGFQRLGAGRVLCLSAVNFCYLP